jgi:hypothetical protein
MDCVPTDPKEGLVCGLEGGRDGVNDVMGEVREGSSGRGVEVNSKEGGDIKRMRKGRQGGGRDGRGRYQTNIVIGTRVNYHVTD